MTGPDIGRLGLMRAAGGIPEVPAGLTSIYDLPGTSGAPAAVLGPPDRLEGCSGGEMPGQLAQCQPTLITTSFSKLLTWHLTLGKLSCRSGEPRTAVGAPEAQEGHRLAPGAAGTSGMPPAACHTPRRPISGPVAKIDTKPMKSNGQKKNIILKDALVYTAPRALPWNETKKLFF